MLDSVGNEAKLQEKLFPSLLDLEWQQFIYLDLDYFRLAGCVVLT